jgi:hypothetical protein
VVRETLKQVTKKPIYKTLCSGIFVWKYGVDVEVAKHRDFE